jgi:hypothetical protein
VLTKDLTQDGVMQDSTALTRFFAYAADGEEPVIFFPPGVAGREVNERIFKGSFLDHVVYMVSVYGVYGVYGECVWCIW